MFKDINTKLDEFSLIKILGIFVTYSIIASILVQLVILPFIFPQFHHGNGLLYGGDWFFYQYRATEFSELIKQFGWDYWELRPKGQGIIGVVFSEAMHRIVRAFEKRADDLYGKHLVK